MWYSGFITTSTTIILWLGVVAVAIILFWSVVKEVRAAKTLRTRQILMLSYSGALILGIILIFLGRTYFHDNFFAHWLRSIGQ